MEQIKKILRQQVLMVLGFFLLFSLGVEAQGVPSPIESQTEVPEEDLLDISDVGGLLKICGVSFGVNSENVHKAVVLDIACPTEDPQLVKKITEELFGNGSDDIKKACKDYLSDVQTGKVKIDIEGSVMVISCVCVCYQKGRVFSCFMMQSEYAEKKELELKMPKLCGWIFDLTKSKILGLEDIFDSDWLSKHAKMFDNSNTFVFLNSDLNIVYGSFSTLLDTKKMKKSLHPEFVALINWHQKPMFITKADIDIRQLIKDVDMMNE